MVKIMTIKKSITTNKTTVKTTKTTGKNTFKFDEKTGVLTLKLECEWNKTHTGLKVKSVDDVKTEKSEYKMTVFHDGKGNTLKMFKTGFEYESAVKSEKPLAVDPKKLDKLDANEKDALMAILAKLA